jgi:outer membrane protein
MSGALSRAYDNNPDINQQRAAVRAKDETVPGAKAGWLPKVNGTGSYGRQLTVLDSPSGTSVRGKTVDRTMTSPALYGATVTQTLFDGNRTSNSVRQAQASVAMARENLRLTELTTLNQAATAYMDVLRDTAVLSLRANNIKVLEVQLRQTRDRFQVGEVTRTDVAQAESSLAGSQADYSLAKANLDASIANFRRLVGVEPRRLDPAQPIERLLPRSLAAAIDISTTEHPAVTAALHQVDMAELAIKVAEAALLPTVGVQGAVSQQTDYNGIPGYNVTTASVLGQVTVPIYQGGAEYAAIRQAKEQMSQAMLTVEHRRLSGGRQGRRSRAEWRARRSQGRPAHHPRRVERPADAA